MKVDKNGIIPEELIEEILCENLETERVYKNKGSETTCIDVYPLLQAQHQADGLDEGKIKQILLDFVYGKYNTESLNIDEQCAWKAKVICQSAKGE